ncbi:hypothetical protein VNI00_011179 [Paramarasmius palmivorus]|uniref:Uncharacterized protein n=1 Tax=Paramarasmius palmivorus TaxID=297713 RepID=A0AAW0CED9_9AGAR
MDFRSTEKYLKTSIINSYQNTVPQWNDSFLVPLVDFMSQVITLSKRHCKSVTESGVLDFFLHLYLTDFRDPLAHQDSSRTFRKSALLGACNHFLLTLVENFGLNVISGHPLSTMWSIHPVLRFTSSRDGEERRWERRRRFWYTSSNTYMECRIASILEITRDEEKILDTDNAMDIVTDCFQLLGPEFPGRVRFGALRSLYEVIVQRFMARYVRTRIWNAIGFYLSELPLEVSVGLLNGVVDMLSSLL